MLTHNDIWRAIDCLAARHGLTSAELARRAGLDRTTFSKSKRARAGRPRWPSTESLARVLDATNSSFAQFAELLRGSVGAPDIPLIGFARAGRAGYFDDGGFPTGGGWDVIKFPNLGDPNAYALSISGDSMEPIYRNGDVVIVSPASGIRLRDRVVIKTADEEVMAKQLTHRTETRVTLASLNPAHGELSVAVDDLEWISRIVWVSQ
jgi:phage repressor protein C with HTH and peptisase S24 domain